jgi:nitroreductase
MEEVQTSKMLDAILARRTVRQFSSEPLDDETIAKVLQMAMYAPTRLGKRPWHFVVIRDQEIIQRLRTSLKVNKGHGDAPVLVAVLAKSNQGFPRQWDLDAAAATQNLLLAATAMGLGSSWVANPTTSVWAGACAWLCDLLGAPTNLALVSLVALGYAAEMPPPYKPEDVYDPKAVHHEQVQFLDNGERSSADPPQKRSGDLKWDWKETDEVSRTRAKVL